MGFSKLILTTLMSISGILSFCSFEKKPDNNDTPNTPVVPDPPVEVIPTIDWDEKDYLCKGGSYGGYFSDINVGRILCTGTSYDFMFESSHATDKSYTVISTDTSICEPVVASSTSKMFDLSCKKQGDVIITIENCDGILVYRNIVRVRKPIAVDEMGDYLSSVDKFVIPQEYEYYLGSYKLSFDYFDEYDGELCGTFKGGDDYDSNVLIIFSLEYELLLDDRDCYSYKLETLSSNSQLTFIGYLNISRAGDWLYLYEDEIKGTGTLLAIFIPSIVE